MFSLKCKWLVKSVGDVSRCKTGLGMEAEDGSCKLSKSGSGFAKDAVNATTDTNPATDFNPQKKLSIHNKTRTDNSNFSDAHTLAQVTDALFKPKSNLPVKKLSRALRAFAEALRAFHK